MSPREKQLRFRSKAKELAAWALMMSAPILLVLDWILIGY